MSQNLNRYANHGNQGGLDMFQNIQGGEQKRYAAGEPGYNQIVAASRMRTNSNNSILSINSRHSSNSNARQNDGPSSQNQNHGQMPPKNFSGNFELAPGFQPHAATNYGESNGHGHGAYQHSRPGSSYGHQQNDVRPSYQNFSSKGSTGTNRECNSQLVQYSSSHKPQKGVNHSMHQQNQQKENINVKNQNISRLSQPQRTTQENQKIKLHKNSMTILNMQQHIQSKDRSHSGSQKAQTPVGAGILGHGDHHADQAQKKRENEFHQKTSAQIEQQLSQQKPVHTLNTNPQYPEQYKRSNNQQQKINEQYSQIKALSTQNTQNGSKVQSDSIKQQLKSQQQQHLHNILNDKKQNSQMLKNNSSTILQIKIGKHQNQKLGNNSKSNEFSADHEYMQSQPTDSLQTNHQQSNAQQISSHFELMGNETQCDPVEAIKSPLNHQLQRNNCWVQNQSVPAQDQDNQFQQSNNQGHGPMFFGDQFMPANAFLNASNRESKNHLHYQQRNGPNANVVQEEQQILKPSASSLLGANLDYSSTQLQQQQLIQHLQPSAGVAQNQSKQLGDKSNPAQLVHTNNRFSLDQPQIVQSSESNKNMLNQSVFENVESIVGGAQGYVTSTFGNKQGTHSRGHSRGNGSLGQVLGGLAGASTDLKNEDTLGVPAINGVSGMAMSVTPNHKVIQQQQFIPQQQNLMTETGKENFENPSQIVDKSIPQGNQQQKLKTHGGLQYQKSQMILQQQKSINNLLQQNNNLTKLKLVTSRNNIKNKGQALQPNKSQILKTQNSSINDFKNTNNQGSGIKKLKIKFNQDKSKNDVDSQSIQKLKQQEQYQQKLLKNAQEKVGSRHSSQRKRLQQNSSSPGVIFNITDFNTGKRKGQNARQRNSCMSSNLGSKQSTNKKGSSMNACSPPIHIHYHNLNYIQVVNNKEQQENIDLVNKTQLQQIHVSKLNLSQIGQGSNADLQFKQRDNLIAQYANSNIELQHQNRKQTKNSGYASEHGDRNQPTNRKASAMKKAVSPNESAIKFYDKSKSKRQNSNNSNISSISGTSALKNKNLSQSKRHEVIQYDHHSKRQSQENELNQQQQNLRTNSPVNFDGQINLNNQQLQNQTGRPKNKVDETLIKKLQESLFNLKHNQQSLMTDSLEGTDREGYAQQYRHLESHRGKQADYKSQSNMHSSRFHATPTNSMINSTAFQSVNKQNKLQIQNNNKDQNQQANVQKYSQSSNNTGKDVILMKRQQVSQENRAKLVSNLAKFIKINANHQINDNSNQRSQRSDNLLNVQMEDIVSNNLRKFLQYLEVNNIININDLQRDKEQYSKFMQKFKNIDYSQIQDPNFMNDQLQYLKHHYKNNKDHKMHRCSSGDPKNFSNSKNQDYYKQHHQNGSLEMSRSRRQGTPVNMTENGSTPSAGAQHGEHHEHQKGQYLYTQGTNPTRVSTSNNLHTSQISNNSQSRLQTSSSQLSNKYNSSNENHKNGPKQNLFRNSTQSQITQNSQQFWPHPQMSRQQQRVNTQVSLPTQSSQISNSQISNQPLSEQIQQPQHSQQTNMKAYKQFQQQNQFQQNQTGNNSQNHPNNFSIQRQKKNHCSTNTSNINKSTTSQNSQNRSPLQQDQQKNGCNPPQNMMMPTQYNRSSSQPNQEIQQLQKINQNKQEDKENSNQYDLQQKPQIHHNTTINLSINANVGNLNINHQPGQSNQPRHNVNHQNGNNNKNQNDIARHDQHVANNNRQQEYHHQPAGQNQQPLSKRQNKNIISQQQQIRYPSNIVGGQGSNLNKNIKSTNNDDDLSQYVQPKQKRGGSHEEQTRDRMKQLLQTNDSSSKNTNENQNVNQNSHQQHQKVLKVNNYHSSRGSTALANYKAYGMTPTGCQNSQKPVIPSSKQPHVQQRARTNSGQRSIHQKQEHIKQSQQQQLNEQIMNDRDKIIKYNKQYIKRYGKFPPTSLDFYKFVKKIGNGAFGQVYLAIHKLTGKFVAIKMIELSQLKDKYSQKKVFQEVYILKKIRHSNIIRLYEVFENKKHIMMVMEYAGGGDLYALVKNSKFLTEDETKYIFKKIAQGIAHCHCRSVLHRDIKLDNILLDGEGGVKICDFGVSRLVTKDEMIQEQCGTPAYLAPEMSSNSYYCGFYVDIWSLGILLYIMLQGTVPFKASSMEGLYECQKLRNIQFPVEISPEAKELIMRMLVITPKDRISIPEILSHGWLKNIIGPDGLPVEDENQDDDDHDFSMSLSFQRQECNLNPLSVGGQNCPPNDNGQLTERCSKAINQPHGEAPDKKHQSTKPNVQTTQQIGNINIINIQNLFPNEVSSQNKLSYMNYCSVTQDFNTYHIDEEALRVLEQFGYTRQLVIESLNKGELNHATCSYDLHVMN